MYFLVRTEGSKIPGHYAHWRFFIVIAKREFIVVTLINTAYTISLKLGQKYRYIRAPHRGVVHCQSAVGRWVGNFRNNASALKTKHTGRPRSVHCFQDNMERALVSVLYCKFQNVL